ncbi:putative HC-toxin efflux carrier TOXA 4 [Colletotrichum chlorophyti]|uniref:Putative HC-toxin efflux carrier TOXA 4 n=1 Tax=Colletotrichum chlorophyti TaxID=708187 RepID=A0A1Q8S7F4_9PEZI|nr:putative HC-toxin efflux carrier TOXA 4 [Colletotrichum chlorophyti]
MGPETESASEVHMRGVAEELPAAGHSPAESIAVGQDASATPAKEAGENAVCVRWVVPDRVPVWTGLHDCPILASLGDLKLLPWVGTGFLLGSVATISLFGSLYNKAEVKWLYLSRIVAFEVGSAICGAAPNMKAMAVGRVVAGIGGNGMYLGCMTYFSILLTPAERPFYTALISAYVSQRMVLRWNFEIDTYDRFWGLGAVLGPVIGGAFAQSKATWRWAFYINLVLAAAIAPIYIFWSPRHGAHRHEKILPQIKNLDWLGAILNAATYALLITACTYSGSRWPWDSGSVIVLWAMTGVTVILFVLQQWTTFLTTKEDRIFPVWCLKSRSLVLLYIGTAGGSAVNFFNVYYIPLFFEFTKGDGPIAVAVCSCSLSLLQRLRETYGFEVLIGAGCGLTLQVAYSIAVVKSPAEKATSAIGFINVAQIGGGAVALAIAGTVFQNVGFKTLQSALDEKGYSSSEVSAALAGGYSAINSNSSPEVQGITSDAIGSTIANVYGISISGAAVLLIAGLLMRWEKVKMT